MATMIGWVGVHVLLGALLISLSIGDVAKAVEHNTQQCGVSQQKEHK